MLRVGCNSSRISSMSAIEWLGWLKWEGTAAVAFACSRLFVTCLCSLKRSRSVRFVSPIYCFLHLLHWIIYVRFVESRVMWCLICLVPPVLLKGYDVFPWLMYGQVRRLCLWSGNGMCWQGAWMCCRCLRVSHERVCHEGLVNGGKRRQVVLYERGTFFVKNDI